MERRDFIKVMGVGAVSLMLGGPFHVDILNRMREANEFFSR